MSQANMHRFFVEPGLLAEKTGPFTEEDVISLPRELAHQVRDVLRLDITEAIILLDNSGDEVLAVVATKSKARVEVRLLERRPGKSEPSVRIILCQGLLKSARFEWILEKGTELGVTAFAPVLCRRSMAGLEDAGPAKLQRWRHIIQEATEQCGRARLPELLPIRPLIHALNDITSGALALMPWEEAQNDLSLREALVYSEWAGTRVDTFSATDQTDQPDSARLPEDQRVTVILFIGPEGGLMPEEVKLAQRHGVQIVTLGPRILRAETAALATVANVMYELERLG